MSVALETLSLPIEGMTCEGCVGNVRRALEAVPGASLGGRRPEGEKGRGRGRAGIAGPSGPGRRREGGAGYLSPTSPLRPPAPLVTLAPSPAPAWPATEDWELAIGGMDGQLRGTGRSRPSPWAARCHQCPGQPGDRSGPESRSTLAWPMRPYWPKRSRPLVTRWTGRAGPVGRRHAMRTRTRGPCRLLASKVAGRGGPHLAAHCPRLLADDLTDPRIMDRLGDARAGHPASGLPGWPYIVGAWKRLMSR